MSNKEIKSFLEVSWYRYLYTGILYNSLFDPLKAKKINRTNSFYSSILARLESFVEKLLSNDEIPFVTAIGANGAATYIGTDWSIDYYKSMNDFIEVITMLSPNYIYSERINTFTHCCNEMRLIREEVYFDNNKALTRPYGGIAKEEVFNDLVNKIRSEWKINKLQAKFDERKKISLKRHTRYCKFVDKLFTVSDELVVLRVKLYYKKEFADSATPAEIIEDFNHLVRNDRCNSIFNIHVGYIAKLELGIDIGINWHVLFFLDESKDRTFIDTDFSKQIGEYWVKTITNRRGAYWSANTNNKQLDALGKLGIGVIHRNNERSRSALNNFVIGYFCKVDLYFKPKFGLKVKLIRRGHFKPTRRTTQTSE